jgi:uncharacterized protein DUF6777/protein kinase-like protein
MPDSPHYLGRYRAERVVGAGAFATVWLAHDETLGAPVAIKVLAENWAHDPEIRERFLEEARILWRANSDHIVRIHNVDELPDGRPYFVMDYADRGTLQERMAGRAADGRRWSVPEAVAVSLAIANGLKVAHALGIVHRDLKPANVMFQSVAAHHGDVRAERLILTDFGIAKSLARSRGTTIATGTPHYMAPEQAEGRADARSDIYSSGVVLYELLAGRVPYAQDSPGRLFASQAAAPPPPISELRDDVPERLADALARALAIDPAERWPTAEAWAAELSAAADQTAMPADALLVDTDKTMSPQALAAAMLAAQAAPAVGVAAAAGGAGSGAGAAGSGPPGPAVPGEAGGGDRGRRKRRSRIAIGVATALIALAAVIVAIVATGGTAADASTLTLMPVSSIGANPWTASVVPSANAASHLKLPAHPRLPRVLGPVSTAKVARLAGELLRGLNPVVGALSTLKFPRLKIPRISTGQLQPVAGSAPGLYGGTQLLSVCNKPQLISYLEANPAKAAAWAAVQGIAAAQIPAYIGGLTDVVLAADTRVTNHGYVNGTANPIDEVLQAGTAVLVDAFGVPRARCYCGNPLTPPRPLASKPTVEGTRWPHFTLQNTVVIERLQTITIFTTTDVLTGTTGIIRPRGSSPTQATIAQPPPPPPPVQTTTTPTTTTTTTPTTTTTTTPTTATTTTSTPTTTTTTAPTTSSSTTTTQTTTTPPPPAENPAASWSPNPGQQGANFTLSVSGFQPDVTLQVSLARPDGTTQSFTITTTAAGVGSITFTNTQGQPAGTYTATITNPNTGARAQASVEVQPAG